MRVSTLLLAAAVLGSACNPDGITGPLPFSAETPRSDSAATTRSSGTTRVTVLSRNMYVGTDVDAVILALASPDPSDDFPALLGAIQVLQQTDFPTRAAAMAAEIQRERPHIVGLQEVSTIAIDLSALGIPFNLEVDFLPVLLSELGSRGLHYQAAAIIPNITAAPVPGVSLTDHDVMLVDADRVVVTPGSVHAKNFNVNLGVVAPGVTLVRGWLSLEGTVDGVPIRFVSTHLESGHQPGLDQLRAIQAQEVATATNGESRVILMGDLNDAPGSPMTQVLAGAGLIDVWNALRPNTLGATCCHAGDLSNLQAAMTQRIDYVFARGIGHPVGGLQGSIDLLGVRPSERLTGPTGTLWPSDHAGLVATLQGPPAYGVAD